MSTDDKIDFSPLALTGDRQRWAQMVTTVTARSLHGWRRSATFSRQVSSWARPVLAVAAMLALIVWAGALWSTSQSTVRADPAYQLSQWAEQDETVSTDKLWEVFGDEYATQ